MKKIALYIVLVIFAAGCTEMPVTLPDKIIPAEGKVILLEDLTGVDCSNCPGAALRLEEIAEEFSGQIIVVGIHGTQQTEPISGSQYDFRNEDAIELEDYLKPWVGKPAVAFNRRLFTDQIGSPNLSLTGIPEIPKRVEELLLEPQTLNIETSFVFDEDSRTIEIFAGVTPLTTLTGDFSITALVTESHIIDAQLSSLFGGINPEYEHNHVLKDVISNTTGDQIASTLTKDETVTKAWTYTIPEANDGLWVLENLEFVVFVSNQADGSKEVLQANKFKLQ